MPHPEDDHVPTGAPLPGGRPTEDDEDTATQQYLDLIRSVHDEWTALEAEGDSSVQLSPAVLSTLKESVRADVRRGAHVQMPPTAAGPYSLSELAVRTLVRDAVDSVPGVIALRTSVEHEPGSSGVRQRGLPTRFRCRISAPLRARDLVQVADEVRAAVITMCREQVGISAPIVDIHIEDVHEN